MFFIYKVILNSSAKGVRVNSPSRVRIPLSPPHFFYFISIGYDTLKFLAHDMGTNELWQICNRKKHKSHFDILNAYL